MKSLRLSQETGMTLALALAVSWFLKESTTLSRVATLIPKAVLVVTLMLLAVQLVLDLRLDFTASARPGKRGVPAAERSGIRPGPVPPSRAVAWIAMLPLVIWLLGSAAGAALFCLIFMRAFASESWTFSLAYALVVGFGIFLLSWSLPGSAVHVGIISKVSI